MAKLVEGKDFLGNKLIINDLVAYSVGSTAALNLGRIISFTPKNVRIQPIRLAGGTSYERVCLKFSRQVIKIPNNEEYLYDLPTSWIKKMFGTVTAIE